MSMRCVLGNASKIILFFSVFFFFLKGLTAKGLCNEGLHVLKTRALA